jgi:hypothetical protein
MGLTRQAVQATVNRLLGEALLEAGENLDHRRSPLIRLTERGHQEYTAVDRRQIRWINELSAGLEISDLTNAARLLRELSDRLENTHRTGRRGDDDDEATWPCGSPPGRSVRRSARPGSRPAPDATRPARSPPPHVFRKVAVPGICAA